MCQIIDGAAIAAQIREELKQEIIDLKAVTNVTPQLVALVAGNNPASEIYVKKKIIACDEVGILSYKINALDEDDLNNFIVRLNNDDNVNAYILQLPLPNGYNQNDYFSKINPMKDADVFNPENVGLLVQGRPRFKPCTPHGVQLMLSKSGIETCGKKVVIVNRSNVVGKPLSSMLIQDCDYANATVTVCHDKTPPNVLKEFLKSADIIVVAVGIPKFITGDMVSPGCVVIDVGITRMGNKVIGDVDFESVSKIAGFISKVPGGCGPMTIAMLLKNTVEATKLQLLGANK